MEVWKDVVGYEGCYKVSDKGSVLSIGRVIEHKNGLKRRIKERVRIPSVAGDGYLATKLCFKGVCKTIKVHKMVATAFLNHKPDGTMSIVVDHIDGNKLNNNLKNLQLITQRKNCGKVIRKNKHSKYLGVYKIKITDKWFSSIRTNDRKQKYLGTFNTELEASNAYQIALKGL